MHTTVLPVFSASQDSALATPAILFLHGFTSGGSCDIARVLAEALGDSATLIAPDIPLHPVEALTAIRSICNRVHPDLMVGSSCGGFYAQQVAQTEGIPALLINPYFRMTAFLEPRMGVHAYKCQREDGVQTFAITSGLIEEFRQMEEHQFDAYTPASRNRVWGLFGTQDHLAHFKTLFLQYYAIARSFEGGHSIDPDNIRRVLVPLIEEMRTTISPLADPRSRTPHP